jgi:hypothetical protein
MRENSLSHPAALVLSLRQSMEEVMSLKGLTFAAKSTASANPAMDRRTRLIAKLEEQKSLAADPKFTRTVRRRVKDGDSNKLVEKQQKVLPWWKAIANGYEFSIRLGKFVEFEKGKAVIVVPTFDKLPGTIDQLISAIRAGDLDQQIAAASVRPQANKPKK